MRLLLACTALALPLSASGMSLPTMVQQFFSPRPELCSPNKVVLEFAPRVTACVTEQEKWDYKRQGRAFFDITNVSVSAVPLLKSSFPTRIAKNESVQPLFDKIDTHRMLTKLLTLTSYHNRYYKSQTGREAAEWLFYETMRLLTESGAINHRATLRRFAHPWGQPSIVVTLPGQSNKTVVVGAHLDDLNLLDFSARAPGADDDGSGCISNLEALGALLSDALLAEGRQPNTIEFHFYSANEGGFLGSLALYQEYRETGRDIKAMLQQDMTGYLQGTTDAGKPEHMGVIHDYTDPALVEYTKLLITAYCGLPWAFTRCGWGCSDHASAHKFGFPSVGVVEADNRYLSPHLLTAHDTLDTVDFEHMRQHSKLAIAFAYELAFAEI